MAILKEFVDKEYVFRLLNKNAEKDKKDVYVTGVKDGEKFRRTYQYHPKRKTWFIKQDGGLKKIKSNVPALDVKQLLDKGFVFDTAIEDDDIILISFTENSDIEESTTAASSGAYQMPFGGKTIKRETMNDIVEINESQFNEMVKKTLVLEYVYGSEGGKTTNQNSGKTKSTAKEQAKKAEKHQKPNTSDKETATYYKKSNPNARDEEKKEKHDIEARQNGMEDIEYDNLPEQAKEQIKKGFEEGGEAGKKLLDQAKKRAKSKDKSTETLTQLGDDIEISKKTEKSKPTVAESYKKYKLSKDYILTEEEDVERLLEAKHRKLKGKVFFLEDVAGNLMKMDWTSTRADIVSLTNPLKEHQEKNKIKSLLSEQKTNTSVKVDENEYFNKFLKKAKQ